MTLEEITKVLEELEKNSYEDRKNLREDYKTSIRENIYQLNQTDRMSLINKFSSVLYDIGACGKRFLTPEDREKRKRAAMASSKYTHTEEIIMDLFHKTFDEDMVWLKSKKAFGKFRSKGINIFPPTGDSNLVEGYLWLRPQGYSICLKSGFPYFYIYIDEKKEDMFLYMRKKNGEDAKTIEINNKAIQFLSDVQKSFANRTPDTIYLCSHKAYEEENGTVLWTETSSNPERLISYTDRITSGLANIVSLSDEMRKRLEETKPNVLGDVGKRNKENATPSTINMLLETRALFDKTFSKEENPKIHQKKYENHS